MGMGNADTSRTSKAKGLLGGLFRRVTGGKPETEEAAPRTGVSLRDRFSTLDPVAVPTEGVPGKMPDNIPIPDSADNVKVIQTSAVRSGGSIRFSDRIGLPVSSDPEDSYERRITFQEEDHEEEEESETTSEILVEELADPNAIGRYGKTFEDKAAESAETDVAGPDVNVTNDSADVRRNVTGTYAPVAGDDYDGGYDFLPRRRNISGRPIAETQTEEEESVNEAVEAAPQPVEEKKSTMLAERLRARNAAAQQRKPSEIEMDGPVQYEYISRRSLLDRITGRNVSEKQDVTCEAGPTGEDTGTMNVVVDEVAIMDTPSTEEASAEVMTEIEDPVIVTPRADDVAETSPHETNAPMLMLSEQVIGSTEITEDIIEDAVTMDTPSTEDVSEEMVIEIADAVIVTPYIDAVGDAPHEESAVMPSTIINEYAEETEDLVEELVITDTPSTEDASEEMTEDVIEEIVIADMLPVEELTAEITEGVIEEILVADMLPVEGSVAEAMDDIVEELFAIETLPVEECCADAVADADAYDLKEIENDIHIEEREETDIDDLENEMLAMSEGVIVGDEIIMTATVPSVAGVAEVSAETLPDTPEAVADDIEIPETVAVKDAAAPEALSDDAFNMCFSFISEENPHPSADVTFVWGR